MNDVFYIGWQEKAPAGIGSFVRCAVRFLFLVAAAVSVLLATSQGTIGVSVFEWGKVKEFSGIFQNWPYPHLLVLRPKATLGQESYSRYYLVQPYKFGLDPELAARLDGQSVRLKGTLIYRENQTMIEVATNSLSAAAIPPLPDGTAPGGEPMAPPVSLGTQSLVGEIVDSKCFLGVMNPGRLTPHRACAIRCISGGIPPVLLVRQTNGPPLYFLLVSREGQPVNQHVLPLVAEPVRITGQVERLGDLLVLRADPATYRRLTH